MTLQVYNTLTRRKVTFVPLQDGRVTMYVCGPTVYDHAHIGHAKLYVSMDVRDVEKINHPSHDRRA